MRVRVWLSACALLCVAIVPAFGQATTPPGHGAMTPEMRAHMMAFARDLLIMTQNTATLTPSGIVVLQGNRLIQYDNNMQLVRTVPLPLPEVAATPPAAAPGATPGQELRSMVAPRLLVAANGDIVVVRGRQLVRLAPDLRVIGSAALPELPALTTTEVAAVVPLAMYIEMMGMAGMGGMATTPTAAAPPAGGPVVAPIADEEAVKE